MKAFKKIIVVVLVFMLGIPSFLAASYQGTFKNDSVGVRSGPGTGYTRLTQLNTGKVVDMVNNTLYKDEGGCSAGWYKVYYSGTKTGYVCSTYLKVTEIVSSSTPDVSDADFETYIKANFPTSYHDGLRALHAAHPKWQFEAVNIPVNFSDAVKAESAGSISLINTKYDGYKTTAEGSYNYLNDTWKIYDGTTWVAAHPDVVAHVMHPANSLTEKRIWQFEYLGFDSSYQTVASIKEVFTSTSHWRNYANTFYNAGKSYSVNPIYLASRVRQETGNDVSTATSGKSFTYGGKTYKSIYNAYNINANSGSDAVYKGLVWAAGGSDGSGTTYGRPWNTLEKSITGGAQWIAKSYISVGQDTPYFQKFNVSPYAEYSRYTHQYMQNIEAPINEASSVYKSYSAMDNLDLAFKFYIPVYKNMPAASKLPNTGNPNNHLKDLKVNGKTITGFDHEKTTYEYYVSNSAKTVEIAATKASTKASLSGTGTKTLSGNNTAVKVVVTAENGKTYTYTVNVIKSDAVNMSVKDIVDNMNVKYNGSYMSGLINKTANDIINLAKKQSPSVEVTIKSASGVVKSKEKLCTGDTITIKNNGESKTYTVVIYGDVSGTGDISLLDLLKIQKHIIGNTKLKGVYEEAAKVSGGKTVGLLDLLKMRKHIIGEAKIDR